MKGGVTQPLTLFRLHEPDAEPLPSLTPKYPRAHRFITRWEERWRSAFIIFMALINASGGEEGVNPSSSHKEMVAMNLLSLLIQYGCIEYLRCFAWLLYSPPVLRQTMQKRLNELSWLFSMYGVMEDIPKFSRGYCSFLLQMLIQWCRELGLSLGSLSSAVVYTGASITRGPAEARVESHRVCPRQPLNA